MKDIPNLDDVYSVGVTARIKQTVKTQSGVFRVIVEPQSRAVLTGFTDDKFTHAEIYEKDDCEELFAVIPVKLIKKNKPVKPCPCKPEPKCHVPEQKCSCNK